MTRKSPSVETKNLIRQSIQLLHHLSILNNTAIICNKNRKQIILASSHNNVSLSRGILPAEAAQPLIAGGYVKVTSQRSFIITEAGKTAVLENCDHTKNTAKIAPPRPPSTKMPTGNIHMPPKAQKLGRLSPRDILENRTHDAIRITTIKDGNETAEVRINDAESPLAWLHKRRDRNGKTFIDDICFEAGERFRRDVTLAHIMPSVTSNWSPMRSKGSGGEPANATDAMISARQRLHLALNAVDENYAGILLDVCGFLKGIEEVERERRWPPRSGKVVLKLALQRLAVHYGLSHEARGPNYSKEIRSWMAS